VFLPSHLLPCSQPRSPTSTAAGIHCWLQNPHPPHKTQDINLLSLLEADILLHTPVLQSLRVHKRHQQPALAAPNACSANNDIPPRPLACAYNTPSPPLTSMLKAE
jgi:hypothetical protein